MKFQSKKDLWLGLIIWFLIPLLLIHSVIMLINEDRTLENILYFIFMLLTVVFLISIWFGTNYTITSDKLIIRSGVLKKFINIEEISEIKESRNPLSSMSLSLDRLAIYVKKGGKVLISPKDKDAFINRMQEVNFKIEISLK